MLTTFISLLFNVFMYQNITTDSVCGSMMHQLKKQKHRIPENKNK